MPHPDEMRGLLFSAVNQVDPLSTAPLPVPAMSIDAGTYLPAVTNAANISVSSIAQPWSWLRVGNTVTISGRIDFTPVSGAPTQTELRVSLPVPSLFVLAGEAAGVFAPISAATEVFAAFALSAGSLIRIAGLATNVAAVSLFGSVTYTIK